MKYGCDNVLDYKKQQLIDINEQFDIILELSGQLAFNEAKLLMNSKAVFIDFTPDPSAFLHAFFINLISNKKWKILFTKFNKDKLKQLAELTKDNLKIHVSKVWSFKDAQLAYNYAEQNRQNGKVVIKIDKPPLNNTEKKHFS